MSLAPPLIPAIDPSVEKETITFDFGPDLGPGEFITGVVSITCTAVVNPNADPTPQVRVLGAPAIGTAPQPKGSGVLNGAVFQLVGTCVATVTYQLQCVVNTSTGQVLSLRGNLPCATPPGT